MAMSQLSFLDEQGPLQKAFEQFHRENPWVFDRLLHHCRLLKARGFKQYSTRTLISVMRYEWDLRSDGEDVVVDGGDVRRVRLNNNHSPYYARKIMAEHKEFSGFFETRRAESDA